jgi:capsular exopolysaccharide synthesis family protein
MLRAIRRRKWLIIMSAVTVGAAVFAGSTRQQKVWEATAQLVIDPVVPKVLDSTIDDLAEQVHAERAFLNTQFKIISSHMILRDVISTLGLASNQQFLETHDLARVPPERQAKAIEDTLEHMINVVPDLTSRLVKIVVEDTDSDRAARIANAVGQSYIDQTLESRLETSRSASKWLDERVSDFAKKIETQEKELYEFKRRNTLVSVSLEDRQNMNSSALATLTGKLVESEAAVMELESKRSVLKELMDQPQGRVELAPTIAKKAIIVDLRSTMAALEKEKAKLSVQYGPSHPNMVAIQQQIDELSAELKVEIKNILTSLDLEIQEQKADQKELNEAISSEKDKAMDLSNLMLDYSKLNRDLGTTKTMYETLLKRQTQADLGGLLKSNFARWFETAEPVSRPTRPSIPRNTLVGVVVGLLLGLAVTVGSVLLDNTVHTQADIETVLRLPFLGVLPSIRGEENKPVEPGKKVETPVRDLFIVRSPKSTVAECLRSVRTNLLFLGTAKPLRRVLLTSAGPVEGKSTVAISLGITMAQAGNRVLLVDTDLRRPRLHKTFGTSSGTGLTNVLLGTSSIEEVIKSTEIVGLDLLPCGPLPPNPAELLHTDKFKSILEQLSAKYDRVLFDSPPINLVTDAAILSQLVDGTIFVVKASKTSKDAVRRSARLLRDIKANILGVLLNDLDFEQGGYEYYSYYRYGYAPRPEPDKGESGAAG